LKLTQNFGVLRLCDTYDILGFPEVFLCTQDDQSTTVNMQRIRLSEKVKVE